MQIGGMRFARVERNDHALVREVDFYILYSGDVRQHRSQFAHTLVAIFTFRGDLDLFQDRVVGPFREKTDRPDRDQSVVQGPYCFLVVSLSNVPSTRSGRLLL